MTYMCESCFQLPFISFTHDTFQTWSGVQHDNYNKSTLGTERQFSMVVVHTYMWLTLVQFPVPHTTPIINGWVQHRSPFSFTSMTIGTLKLSARITQIISDTTVIEQRHILLPQTSITRLVGRYPNQGPLRLPELWLGTSNQKQFKYSYSLYNSFIMKNISYLSNFEFLRLIKEEFSFVLITYYISQHFLE